MRIYHLALATAWTVAQEAGVYTASTLGRDLAQVGFIHCAQGHQVAGVYQRFYTGVTEAIMLLTIETDDVASPWRLDDVPGESSPFPHIYGPLEIDAVVSAEQFRPSAWS